jgi:hypothetical protein
LIVADAPDAPICFSATRRPRRRVFRLGDHAHAAAPDLAQDAIALPPPAGSSSASARRRLRAVRRTVSGESGSLTAHLAEQPAQLLVQILRARDRLHHLPPQRARGKASSRSGDGSTRRRGRADGARRARDGRAPASAVR